MQFAFIACAFSILSFAPTHALQGGAGSSRGTAGAQQPVGSGQSSPTAGPASLVVTTMPGFPSEPRILPSQRHPVRPDTDVIVWGSVNHGDGTATGATYSWSFFHGANVLVVDDGDLTGVVTETRFVPEVVRFELQGGATSAVVKAVLECSLNSQVASREVEIAVVSNSDPISDSPLEEIEFDRQVAVENGLRYLYVNGETGIWSTNGGYTRSATAFAVWAFEIHGHVPINDADEDVYVPLVREGLRHLTEDSIDDFPALGHTRADETRGAAMEDVADQNLNTRCIALTATDRPGYELPMTGSAIVASLAPDTVVQGGELAGLTYRVIVEDIADRIAGGITIGDDTTNPPWKNRGGWRYSLNQNNIYSDMSINSWAYVFFEGAESVLGVDVPDWVKQEAEWTLASHQFNGADSRPFGYIGTSLHLDASIPGMATTGGGLSGLAFVETVGPYTTPGEVVGDLLPPLNTIAAKRQAALAWFGDSWGVEEPELRLGRGNRGNPYVMWTVARALRLTADALHLPGGEVVPLSNGGITFDWETGYQANSGVVAPQGSPREGYFPYLIRTQWFDGTDIETWGRWIGPHSQYSTAFTTAAYVLVLGRDVFLDAGCDEAVAAPVNLVPASSSVYPTGETIVLSGLAIPATLDRQILGVLVDGQVPEVVDSQWNFFQTVVVNEGLNSHVITVIDSCSSEDFVHEFIGASGGAVVFDNLSEATPLIATEYTNTTWNPGAMTLQFDVEACNLDEDTLRPPLVLVLEGLVPADAELLNADGVDEAGNPFVRFEVSPAGLSPGACAPTRHVVFELQELAQLEFEAKWFAEGQLPPEITTIPIVSADQGSAYSYDADAVDPNGTPLTWSLPTGPSGMTIDATAGVVTWNPTPATASSHLVRIRVEDTDGDFAEQSFSLLVDNDINRPPFFVSLPVTSGMEGVPYEYAAFALDMDNDMLHFQLLESPGGMTVDSDTGFVSWLPGAADVGAHAVVLEADDGHGGMATQSYALEISAN